MFENFSNDDEDKDTECPIVTSVQLNLQFLKNGQKMQELITIQKSEGLLGNTEVMANI